MKRIIRLMVVLLCLSHLLMVSAEKAIVKVSNGWLNMREKPLENAEIVGKLKNGLELDVDGSQDMLFYAILSGENVIGWARKSYIYVEKKDPYMPLKFRVLGNYSATSDWKGDVTIVREVEAGDIVEGVKSVKGFIHLLGGGFVPESLLEEIE